MSNDRLRRRWKTSLGLLTLSVAIGIIGLIGYRQLPTEVAYPECAKNDDAARAYYYDHELNERFAVAFAAYLMREGANVRFEKETSKVLIAPAHSLDAPFIRASKNAAAIILYGTDPERSILHANGGGNPEVTCEQVKRLSAK